MAHNAGGPRVPPRPPPALVPRVHHRVAAPPPVSLHHQRPARRAPAAMSVTPPPLTAPLTPLRPRVALATTPLATASTTTTPVSLTTPRPDGERTLNEYVETPFRPNLPSGSKPEAPTDATGPSRSLPPPPIRPASLPLAPVVTKQPGKRGGAGGSASDPASGDCVNRTGSIICGECGRCRCESCQQPRPLPQRWVCDNACLCSADAVIDYASCLCCVKGLFYHCSDADGGGDCADAPCSCAPPRRFARWGCLAALAVPLPCLLCYWPLRGCTRAIEAAYARRSRAGCRCAPPPHLLPTPEKRLLDSPSPSPPDF